MIDAIDLFCGVGGLTHGLEESGVTVRAGLDNDPACSYAYERNNSGHFIEKNIHDVTGDNLSSFWQSKYRLLAGCAPCQPFSNYTQKKGNQKDSKWGLLNEFTRLVEETLPELVTMENVPALSKTDVFENFTSRLEELGYHVWFNVVRCVDYGVPQNRKRLVLMASRLGKIALIPPTHSHPVTVEEVIRKLPKIQSGEQDKNDPLHISSSLSPINLERIRHSKPGGSWRDWPKHLIVECHKKQSGERYGSVYGRMRWDQPAPTMTTLCYGFGNGRFGHPEQDRGISLREAAIFQTFPEGYEFRSGEEKVMFKTLGRLIGNAVPVRLGEVIGLSFLEHLKEYTDCDNVAVANKPLRFPAVVLDS